MTDNAFALAPKRNDHARFAVAASGMTRGMAWGMTRVMTLVMAFIMVASIAIADDEGDPLPELGDSAAQILSPAQEKRIGQQFLRQLIRDKSYVGDPALNDYINRMGMRVAAHADMRDTVLSVHLLENPELNAFAVPGGHIILHTGLIYATDSESELAAVVGHEIAHVSQRHLPRMLAKSEASKLPAAAAILASVFVGGKAGLAGLTVANAALLSNKLAFTREFEREADSIGIKLLADAEYDPTAMARFFNKLDRYGLGDEAPEFLRTHPLPFTRIAQAENRAAAYPPNPLPPNRTYLLAKAKARALYSERDRDALAYFEARAQRTEGDAKRAAIYGIALSLQKLRQIKKARATLQPLLDAYPEEVAFQIARAEIDADGGNPAAAAARYEKLTKAHPDLDYLIHYQIRALIKAGDAAAAKRIARHQLRRHKDQFTLYPLLSESNAKLGLLAEAHQATAEFHAVLGEYEQAVEALKQALRKTDSEGYLHQSISARLQVMEEKLEQSYFY